MAPINLKLDPEKPLGEQLVREFERLIAVGEWQPGERVPSVRTLAMQFGVNPNTIQKALAALDERGLLEALGTSGRFVTADEELISRSRSALAQAHANQFAQAMQALKIPREQALSLLESHWNHRKNNHE